MTNPFIQVSIFKARTNGEINFKRCRLFKLRRDQSQRVLYRVTVKILISYSKFRQIGELHWLLQTTRQQICNKGKLFIALQKNANFLATKKSLPLDGVWESRIVLEQLNFNTSKIQCLPRIRRQFDLWKLFLPSRSRPPPNQIVS